MSQYRLNKRWFHRIADYFIPNNCRRKLELALYANHTASVNFLHTITHHEHEVIAALKGDRRKHG